MYLWLDVLDVVGNYHKVVGVCSGGACGGGCLERYPKSSFSSHLRRGSRNIINM